MPIAITRFFDDPAEANAASRELVQDKKLPRDIVRAFKSADGMVTALTNAGVDPGTAGAYDQRMAQGGAVLLVVADYTPLGVARITRETLAGYNTADMGSHPEEAAAKYARAATLSVLPNSPRMLTRLRDPSDTTYHMANWPIPLITKGRGPRPTPLVSSDDHMASWPIGLSLPRNIRFGKFPFGLLVPGHKFMAKFPFAHLIPGHKFQAKFPFGHLVPGHRRMANWPFPLLINDTSHSNSLIPGHKYQAKFPFAHLIPGHKYQAKFPFGHIVPRHRFMAKFPFAHIVPGHRFMAKFPFGHIVPGHKFQAKFPFAHIVPGHKFMANWILPHTKAKGT